VGESQPQQPYAYQSAEAEPLTPDYTEEPAPRYDTLDSLLERWDQAAERFQGEEDEGHFYPAPADKTATRSREPERVSAQATAPEVPRFEEGGYGEYAAYSAETELDPELQADLQKAYAADANRKGLHPLRKALRNRQERRRAIQWVAVLQRPEVF